MKALDLARWRELESAHAVTEVDERDRGTPDEWVHRHVSLVRLTGRHPFNVEPPLSSLLDVGPVTPAALHYVRNHGAVPRLDWNTHRLDMCGEVPTPRCWSMDELAALPGRYTLPVLLVCAGNRRKEQNMCASCGSQSPELTRRDSSP
jgi:nitrate reductase (NAD(P)H)